MTRTFGRTTGVHSCGQCGGPLDSRDGCDDSGCRAKGDKIVSDNKRMDEPEDAEKRLARVRAVVDNLRAGAVHLWDQQQKHHDAGHIHKHGYCVGAHDMVMKTADLIERALDGNARDRNDGGGERRDE